MKPGYEHERVRGGNGFLYLAIGVILVGAATVVFMMQGKNASEGTPETPPTETTTAP